MRQYACFIVKSDCDRFASSVAISQGFMFEAVRLKFIDKSVSCVQMGISGGAPEISPSLSVVPLKSG